VVKVERGTGQRALNCPALFEKANGDFEGQRGRVSALPPHYKRMLPYRRHKIGKVRGRGCKDEAWAHCTKRKTGGKIKGSLDETKKNTNVERGKIKIWKTAREEYLRLLRSGDSRLGVNEPKRKKDLG